VAILWRHKKYSDIIMSNPGGPIVRFSMQEPALRILIRRARYYWLLLAESHLSGAYKRACCAGFSRCRCGVDRWPAGAQMSIRGLIGSTKIVRDHAKVKILNRFTVGHRGLDLSRKGPTWSDQ
jgi:hypothetical protein